MTYWQGKGEYQDWAMRLYDMIPDVATPIKVRKAVDLSKLETFRRASNAYYALHNGLLNPDIFDVLKIDLSDSYYIIEAYSNLAKYDWPAIYYDVEPIFEKIILDAAREQGWR
jgi:hypothetical protein